MHRAAGRHKRLRGGGWLLLATLLTAACVRRPARVEPREAEGRAPATPTASETVVDAVGAVEVFGQGIVTIGESGDRVLVRSGAAAYMMLVRLDSTGAIMSGSASPRRYPPGSVWLEVPSARGRQGHTAVATAPFVCDDLVYGTRRPCRAPADLVVTSPALRTGEALLLFLTAEPFGTAGLDERLNAVGRRVPLTQLPGLVMDGRHDLWAAYLVRRR